MKNKNHKISVIIPAHNVAKTINRCIDSILAQTYKNFEIIVVDNASIDDLAKIIEAYNDNRIKYYKTDELGVSNARNIGIKRSSGEFVSFCDADDEYDPCFLEKMFSESLSNNVNIVKCAVGKIDSKNEITVESLHELAGCIVDPNNLDDNKILRNLFFRAREDQVQCTTPSLLIRRRILTKNNIIFDKNIHMMEDVLFYADLFNSKEKIKFIEDPLYYYHQNSNSATHAKNNYKIIIDGATLSCSKLHERLGKDSDTDMKYLKIIFYYMYCEYLLNGNIYFPSDLIGIAQRAKNSNSKKIWITIAKIMENKNYLLLKLLFCMRGVKSKIKDHAKNNKVAKGVI